MRHDGGVDADDFDDSDEIAPTGHDLHFLGRVAERVDYGQADLALRLYRDPALVKALLADEAPSGAERIAVALALGPSPPHALIERGGHFVTCLAAGMSPSDAPVVSRERLEIHLQRAALRAERDARIREVISEGPGRVRRLVARVADAGSRLTREEVEQLLAIAPMLETVFLRRCVNTLGWLVDRAPQVRRIKRFPPSLEPKLLKFWNRVYSVGHCLVLASSRGKESFELWHDLADALRPNDPWGTFYLETPLGLGHGFVSLRALWALARAGSLAVPCLKRVLVEADDIGRWYRAAVALVAIGHRHRSLRGELHRAVGSARLPADLRSDETVCEMARHLQRVMLTDWSADDSSRADWEAGRRGNAESIVEFIERGDDAEEVEGDELSIARLAHAEIDFGSGPLMALGAALLATARPEELYFPVADIDEAPAFSPEAAVALARFAPEPPQPARAVEKPGRNDPCSCGSGKKYKRCCGAN